MKKKAGTAHADLRGFNALRVDSSSICVWLTQNRWHQPQIGAHVALNLVSCHKVVALAHGSHPGHSGLVAIRMEP